MTARVFVTRPIPHAGLERLRQHFQVNLREQSLPPTREELIKGLSNADGLLCQITDPVDSSVLQSAPKLRVVSNMAVGVDNIDVPAATKLGIPVGHTPGVLTDATADLTVALMLAAARCFREGMRDVTSGAWKTWQPTGYRGQDLLGKTLGIVGLGRIGAAVARRLRGGWGMRVLYHAPRPSKEADALDAKLVALDVLLRESDFISMHCPLTPDTRGLIGEAQFRMMRPTAVFVNTARGTVIDQKALIRALQEKWIFSAGLDVTDPEPPDPADPLLQLPNLVLMPHVGSATQSTRDKMAILAVDNLIAGLAGRPLPHSVNPQVQARK
jgi:lactate dehydrogenase-like 2-hydroxyacid dehydrogenase